VGARLRPGAAGHDGAAEEARKRRCLNVLSGFADYSTQSGQPATKHIIIEVAQAVPAVPVSRVNASGTAQ